MKCCNLNYLIICNSPTIQEDCLHWMTQTCKSVTEAIVYYYRNFPALYS